MHSPAELAEELLTQGYRAMKLWSFDEVYWRQGGHFLSWQDIEEGVAPFRAIRERVGNSIEVMLDGHGFFSLAPARRIAA
ncbi:MAG: mandelate racemase/muconate lactonizing enzyme family protein, partial [Acidobacteria bacterium]